MTQVVADAERRGQLPPLSMSDLMAAFALSRLAEALEHRIMSLDRWLPDDRPYTALMHYPPEAPEYLPEWRVRFCRAIYRTLTVGAALVGAYNEPMFRAPRDLGLDKAQEETVALSEAQFEFLRKFAVCRKEYDAEADEAVFGSIARWLLRDILSNDEAKAAMAKRFTEGFGRAKYCQSRNGDCPVALLDGGTHSDAHLVAWEVMQLLWLQNNIHEALCRPGSLGYPEDECPTNDGRSRATAQPPGREVTAAVVLFGIFNTDHISMPEVFTRQDVPVLFAHVNDGPAGESTAYLMEDGNDGVGRSAQVFFWRMYRRSQLLDDPPLTREIGDQRRLKFFQYYFRRHLGLRFLPCGDELSATDPADFLTCLTLFSHDDIHRRTAYTHGTDFMSCDFLDGTEMLIKPEVRHG